MNDKYYGAEVLRFNVEAMPASKSLSEKSLEVHRGKALRHLHASHRSSFEHGTSLEGSVCGSQ
ncbi:MAG TPA: hypothetical protein VF914_02220, partial [Chloroflexia bacterium]